MKRPLSDTITPLSDIVTLRVEILKAANAFVDQLEVAIRDIKKLEQDNSKMRVVLEFYANRDNWLTVDALGNYRISETIIIRNIDDVITIDNGELARQCLFDLNKV